MAKRKAAEYVYQGKFDHAIVRTEFAKEFAAKPKYSAGSTDNLIDVLGRIEADSTITDIRWMAYMLGTVYLESSRALPKTITTKDKKGHEVTKQIKTWVNFAPQNEVGRGSGLAYGPAVKVTKQADGKLLITEQDGDQWVVNLSGSYRQLHAKDKLTRGVKGLATPVDAYTNETGDEYSYYGRGYTQLTWWFNYATAGEMLGRGHEFLLDPELVNEPANAYAILSTGMRTGSSFANGAKFSQFFHDDVTNYAGARAMVNPADKKNEVTGFAEAFERILFAARLPVLVPTP